MYKRDYAGPTAVDRPVTCGFSSTREQSIRCFPEEIWRALRLKAEREAEFTLADGTPIERGVSECQFEIRGEAATSPVVLGQDNDGALLGAVTLETLGLMLNPLTRENLADAHGIPPA